VLGGLISDNIDGLFQAKIMPPFQNRSVTAKPLVSLPLSGGLANGLGRAAEDVMSIRDK
jgi:hypothetical protein